MDTVQQRRRMVETDIEARGVRDSTILEAMREVPRERFVDEELAEYAYADAPLPIEEGQTISQPFVVALMAEAMELEPDDRVLEVGAGSGYAAAVLSRIAGEVWSIERHGPLAEAAAERCRALGYDNVRIVHGDGTLGLPEHAPYDAIAVAAGAPRVPRALLEQLAPGGRLVIPVGDDPRTQQLLRVRRAGEDVYVREDLGGVRFVPLIGAQGWQDAGAAPAPEILEEEGPIAVAARAPEQEERSLATLIGECAEPLDSIEDGDVGSLLERIGEARVVLLGEATHGTSEFYRMRSRLTRELVTGAGFDVLAIEGDWPDVARVDRFVRHRAPVEGPPPFQRFPTWMWRNREFAELVDWLREHNRAIEAERRVTVVGLDLYSLYASRDAVLRFLERVDPPTAAAARTRYGCLSRWERDPAAYGRAALTPPYRTCEREAVAMLVDLHRRRIDYELDHRDGLEYFDALQNARVVVDAERYYRVMYYGHVESWNLRDQHMFAALRAVLEERGPGSRAVVWAHNSHLGDARSTEMGVRGEVNVGQLAREHFGAAAYAIGFSTDHGVVSAASEWEGPMERKRIRPALEGSYESLCHRAQREAFLLHLREPRREELREELRAPRLERAIGVIYRPETELASHYFQAVLPEQFDSWVWFDETGPVDAFRALPAEGVPDTYPFGL
ncbi:MAG TPA: protein-L-isoaspartate(D-aspartate) O-methyltransferase [Thermoanaerobaculia bacterium]|nr:protein-L-isoaspartate(D-aspartate) O-methyltransferase [Thermoanaerobaculia bacterium]